MTLIKITGYPPKLILKFENPIDLDPDKKYKLGIFKINFNEYLENRNNYFSLNGIEVRLTLPNNYTHAFVYTDNPPYLIEDIEGSIRNTLKQFEEKHKFSSKDFQLKLRDDGKVFLRTPVLFSPDKKFYDIFGFDFNNHVFEKGIDHIGEFKPKPNTFKMIEVHCNIASNSYTHHETHPHLHSEYDLLNVFNEKELREFKTRNHLFVPLKKHLRKIDRIELTICDENHKPLYGTYNIWIYLQLLEE